MPLGYDPFLDLSKQQNNYTTNIQSQQERQTKLAKLWRNPEMRDYLIEKIKEKKNRGDIEQEKVITEKLIIDEYWKYWFTIPEKNRLKKIYSYPSLTEYDFQKLNFIVQQQKANQFYWATGATVFSLFMYKVGFSKNQKLYNFYRKPPRKIFGRPIPWYNGIKVALSLASLEVSWLICMNYFFDQAIPNQIQKEGLFAKYGIEIEKRNL
ncbi:hypothetical protein PPERSA_04681 [Pseudocohnilembus persalinus]|uniref:Uncharacterized protein n=1 Tax=Pseudocohnilembus persalinus TaxID=266149 RepID=A0A0V0R4H3_PSEPJ|nr:hypothetical protein PPERSA_04681 [Pseudocohnilembus persalinus]|eukprot:KRX09375.1 hypothetical protein PPERSA_04681 [Pseudocohnilembus persalinus]